LFAGGLEYPTIAAGAGLVYLAGRYFYAKGYQTGEPSKRMQGGFQYLGLVALLGLSIKAAISLILSK
jgi:glutathione S-transferase